MRGYRIPFRMFFQWFVPYGTVPNRLIALFTPAAVLLAYYAIFIRPDWRLPLLLKVAIWFPWGLGVFLSPFAFAAASVLLAAYHRPLSRKQALFIAVSSWLLGGALIALVSAREIQTLLWSLVLCLPLAVASGLFAQESAELRHRRISPPHE